MISLARLRTIILAVVFSSTAGYLAYDTLSTPVDPNPSVFRDKPEPTLWERFTDALVKKPSGREMERPQWRNDWDQAVAIARQGQFDVALAALELLKTNNPDITMIAVDHATVLAWAGRYQEATDEYKKLPTVAQPPTYFLDAIGVAYRNLKNYDEALALYRMAKTAYPDNQNYWTAEIYVLLDADRAEEAYQIAVLAEQSVPTRDAELTTAIMKASSNYAVALARGGKFAEALPLMDRLLATYPDETSLQQDFIVALSWAGQDDRAIQFYLALSNKKAIADIPEYVVDAAAHSYRKQRQPTEALALYKELLNRNPTNPVYTNGVTRCLADINETKKIVRKNKIDKARGEARVTRDIVIREARSGKFDNALKTLTQQKKQYPSDRSLKMDYVAVSSWANRHKEAIAESQSMRPATMPNYVLAAVAYSHRVEGNSARALELYSLGEKRFPRNRTFVIGSLRSLMDLNRHQAVLDKTDKLSARYKADHEVILIAGEASEKLGHRDTARSYFERVLASSPKNTEALQRLADLNKPQPVAAPQPTKQAVKDDSIAQQFVMLGDRDADLVRMGAEEDVNLTHFAGTDGAINTLQNHIEEWKNLPHAAARRAVTRAQIDLLQAYYNRNRTQDVIRLATQLSEQGITLPPYSLFYVADAHMAQREPEKARDILQHILTHDPRFHRAKRLLAYAYFECQQYDEAIQMAAAFAASTTATAGAPGQKPTPNPFYKNAYITLSKIQAYSGQTDDAKATLDTLRAAIGNDEELVQAYGDLAMMRGQPHAALRLYEQAETKSSSPSLIEGKMQAHFATQNFDKALAESKMLQTNYSETLYAQRASKAESDYKSAEITAHVGYSPAALNDPQVGQNPNGQSLTAGTEIYSAPFATNWRLYGGTTYSYQHEPNDEGRMAYRHYYGGINYRNNAITANVAPSYNSYKGQERIGLKANTSYAFDDTWTAAFATELFSTSTPLRALNAGTTASDYAARLQWRQGDQRTASLGLGVMTFSDDNVRTSQNINYIEHFYTDPVWRIDGETALSVVENSQDQNRLYFNPSSAASVLVGPRVTQRLYEYYNTSFDHSLLVLPGIFTQTHYGTDASLLVRYEHSLNYQTIYRLNYGVNYNHQAYDGSAEDNISLFLNIGRRF